jgi:hypothetical protein
MKRIIGFLATINLLVVSAVANAGIISSGSYADDTTFSAATGAVSLTGALPDYGDTSQGTSVTLGDATLSAGNSIFVGSGWSSLMPSGNAIAISGPENMSVSINTDLSNAFGFYFHEPSTNNSTALEDECNATCSESIFSIEFYLSGSTVDSLSFSPANDQLVFMGIVLDESFDSVKFTETTGGIDNEFFGEMFIAKVPEPTTLTLLFTAAAGLLFARRKRAA